MKLRKILLKRFIITAGVSILLTAGFLKAAFCLFFHVFFFNSRFLVYFFFFGKNNIKRLYKYSRKSL